MWCFESCLIVMCVFEKAIMLGVFFCNYVINFIRVLCPNVGAFSIWYNFRNQWWIWRQHKSLQQRCESSDQCKLSSFFVTSAETVCFPATKLHYLLWHWTFNISFCSNYYSIITAGCWKNDGSCFNTTCFATSSSLDAFLLVLWHLSHAAKDHTFYHCSLYFHEIKEWFLQYIWTQHSLFSKIMLLHPAFHFL